MARHGNTQRAARATGIRADRRGRRDGRIRCSRVPRWAAQSCRHGDRCHERRSPNRRRPSSEQRGRTTRCADAASRRATPAPQAPAIGVSLTGPPPRSVAQLPALLLGRVGRRVLHLEATKAGDPRRGFLWLCECKNTTADSSALRGARGGAVICRPVQGRGGVDARARARLRRPRWRKGASWPRGLLQRRRAPATLERRM